MEPIEIDAGTFSRAALFIESYALPMARRSYAYASLSKGERAARRLLTVIQEHGWERFTSREVLRLDRKGLTTATELNPALTVLAEADVILSLIHISEPTRRTPISYAVFCLK